MKVIGRFLVRSKSDELLDEVTCFIDLDNPFNHYVELISPCSAAFSQEEGNFLFVKLHRQGPEFEVTLIADNQKLVMQRDNWEGFKTEFVNSLNCEKTNLIFVGLQEFQWKPASFHGPLDEDMIFFRGSCLINFDEGVIIANYAGFGLCSQPHEILSREYEGISGVTMQRMTVRTAHRNIDLVKNEGQFSVKNLKDFQADICLSLPRWAKNGLIAF